MISRNSTPENLYINGLINRTDKVKILGNGELKAKIPFRISAVSEKAKSAIEAAGGSIRNSTIKIAVTCADAETRLFLF